MKKKSIPPTMPSKSELQEKILKKLQINRSHVKDNLVAYLPKLIMNLKEAYYEGLIDAQSALDELMDCLRKLYLLHAEGNHDLITEIEETISTTLVFSKSVTLICKDFIDEETGKPVRTLRGQIDDVNAFIASLKEIYFNEAEFLKELATHNNAYSPLFDFMLEHFLDFQNLTKNNDIKKTK